MQTWRQLWRVLEVGDIVVLITDIRHPVSDIHDAKIKSNSNFAVFPQCLIFCCHAKHLSVWVSVLVLQVPYVPSVD